MLLYFSLSLYNLCLVLCHQFRQNCFLFCVLGGLFLVFAFSVYLKSISFFFLCFIIWVPFQTSWSWQDLICRMATSVKEQSTKPVIPLQSPPCEWVLLCVITGLLYYRILWFLSEKKLIILLLGCNKVWTCHEAQRSFSSTEETMTKKNLQKWNIMAFQSLIYRVQVKYQK